ncbi:hypothetical protein [Streptomyces chryseus]|uniref:Uncharacterized protein n=1 Tax=Streptomyces chryseus TaxID=68186 RepID=A0ABQ3EA52_9ACTN|nr:hypothetical protein [Streptomyces chryseus]GHB31054.1 hypothetical protein GCM10010346_63030 [Streptomyces chryseus]
MSVAFRISCCLCRKNIPLTGDVFALDAEWQRRFPAMVGTLACRSCAMGTTWRCTSRDGSFVDGHIPVADGPCFDAWNHVSSPGTHRGMVQGHPRSGLIQGAGAYLRSVAARKDTVPEYAAMLRTVIQEWDEQHNSSGAPQSVTV